MESISKRTGKKFTGKFASTAVRLRLATPSGEESEEKVSKTKSSEKSTEKTENLSDNNAGTITVPDKINLVKGSAKSSKSKTPKGVKAVGKVTAKKVKK